jgi:hypothetical protein
MFENDNRARYQNKSCLTMFSTTPSWVRRGLSSRRDHQPLPLHPPRRRHHLLPPRQLQTCEPWRPTFVEDASQTHERGKNAIKKSSDFPGNTTKRSIHEDTPSPDPFSDRIASINGLWEVSRLPTCCPGCREVSCWLAHQPPGPQTSYPRHRYPPPS